MVVRQDTQPAACNAALHTAFITKGSCVFETVPSITILQLHLHRKIATIRAGISSSTKTRRSYDASSDTVTLRGLHRGMERHLEARSRGRMR